MEDRISTLPSNIIEVVLMRLPIADAVRTSVLSSRWRYQWCSIPHLIFNKKSVPSALHLKLDKVVDQVLLLHNGPIHKFAFDGYADVDDFAAVDRWMVFLSRNDIKELSLKFCQACPYRIPSVLYSCQAIISLDLHDCEFRLPRNFNGFSCLTNLILENISISDDDFSSLISKCLLLRSLVFVDFYGCCHLKLNAPRLQELVVEGVFDDIHLDNTPELATLSVGLEDDEELDNDDEDIESVEIESLEQCYFNKCLSNILKIENLELQHNFLDFMTRGHAFVRFPTYSCLKKVFLSCFNFEDLKHVLALQSLLENTPALQKLEIEVPLFGNVLWLRLHDMLCGLCSCRIIWLQADSDDSIATIPTTTFFDKKQCPDINLHQLRTVRLIELMGVRPEVEFIEFILSCASALETLVIKLESEAMDEVKVYKEIMRFRRASSRAEIEILD